MASAVVIWKNWREEVVCCQCVFIALDFGGEGKAEVVRTNWRSGPFGQKHQHALWYALKEILLQHSSPIYFPAALKLWNFVVKNAILVKETHTVCGCCRCRDSLVNHKLSSSVRSSGFCCCISCGIDTASSTGFSTLRNKSFSENIESLN